MIAEFGASCGHTIEVELGVLLFFLQGVEQSLAEGVGSIGELEQGQGHELYRKELVIAEEVQKHGAVVLVAELFDGGNFGAGPATGVGTEGLGATW